MSIKAGYYNGERVYEFGWLSHIHPDMDYQLDILKVQVIRHRDIVWALNNFLKAIENADNEVLGRPLGIGHELWEILNSLAGRKRLIIKEKNKETFPVDDPQKIKKSKMPRLYTGIRNKTQHVHFKVYEGGLSGQP